MGKANTKEGIKAIELIEKIINKNLLKVDGSNFYIHPHFWENLEDQKSRINFADALLLYLNFHEGQKQHADFSLSEAAKKLGTTDLQKLQDYLSLNEVKELEKVDLSEIIYIYLPSGQKIAEYSQKKGLILFNPNVTRSF